MKYLLDTHSFLWVLFDDEKLSEKVKEIVREPENEIYTSVITYWEISLKYSIGKLEIEGISPDELPIKAKEIGIETLEISEEETASFYKLPNKRPTIKNDKKYGLHISPSPLRGEAGWG